MDLFFGGKYVKKKGILDPSSLLGGAFNPFEKY